MSEPEDTFVETPVSTTSPADRVAPSGASAYVLIMEGETSSMFPLPEDGEVIVGRAETAGLRLRDHAVSRAHFKLIVSGAAVQVADLGSQNGTKLNGTRITGTRPMASGDAITIGATTLLLHTSARARGRRALLAYDAFRHRAEEELERGSRRGLALVVMLVRDADADATGVLDPVALLRRADGELRRHDALGQSAADVVLALLPDVDAATATTIATQVVRAIRKDAPHIRAGIAIAPADGIDVDTLLLGARAAAETAPAGGVAAAADTYRKLAIGSHDVVIADPAMLRVFALVERLAKSDLAVLVCGETGTGKELVAAGVHAWSSRSKAPLVSWNCAALSETLAESELFGHEKGAYTGAASARAGLLEAADGGTIFCDEIGELPLAVQAKLLRALETKRIVRVGSTEERAVDFRLVAATNRDLSAEVKAGRFRQDLLFRIGGATVWLPPLRDRRREIPLLAHAFVAEACARAGREPMTISDEALATLLAHPWPGNVRELRQVIDYVVAAFPDEAELAGWHLADRLRGSAAPPSSMPPPIEPAPPSILLADDGSGMTLPERFDPLEDEIRKLEKLRMSQALAVGGSQAAAAELLKMPLRTFQAKAKQFGLRRKDRD